MHIGTRVLYPEEVGSYDAELFQISVYRGMEGNLDLMKRCATACRKAGISYVVHPVRYPLLEKDTYEDLLEMARWTDLALILHDEKSPGAQRIGGKYEIRFRDILAELRSITSISFENSVDTGDAGWFWDNFADSITLDVGHVESFGLNSLEFVISLDEETVKKIQFVHIHRNNGLHGGITDHWPLKPDCREIRALEELVKVKPDVKVMLEINEIEEIGGNLDLLRKLRGELLGDS